jgi:transaldolase
MRRYIDEWSVMGLMSNPTIFDHAIENSHFYDEAIRHKSGDDTVGEALFFELALDLSNAAALFRPVHGATRGLDGWVSLEVSPLLANDTDSTIRQAAELHARAKLPIRWSVP